MVLLMRRVFEHVAHCFDLPRLVVVEKFFPVVVVPWFELLVQLLVVEAAGLESRQVR